MFDSARTAPPRQYDSPLAGRSVHGHSALSPRMSYDDVKQLAFLTEMNLLPATRLVPPHNYGANKHWSLRNSLFGIAALKKTSASALPRKRTVTRSGVFKALPDEGSVAALKDDGEEEMSKYEAFAVSPLQQPGAGSHFGSGGER